MTKSKCSRIQGEQQQLPPPPLPPPLTTSYGSNAESDDQSSPTDLSAPSPSSKDLKKYLHQLPPPAFHQYPQLVHQAVQSQPSSSKQAPTLPVYQPNFAHHYLNPYSSSSTGATTTTPTSNYLRRTNLPYDPATHGIISRLAEERTRSTFSSIEAILDAFSSINMILDSTYSAIHGSFKTITGVADHLIFVRNHLAEIALFPRVIQIVARFARWLLQALGLGGSQLAQRLGTSSQEQLWNESLAKDFSSNEEIKQLLAQSTDDSGHSSPLWPIFVFFSLVLGTPYIIWRLLGAPGSIPRTNCPEWTLRRGRHFVAVGLYDFKARNQNELSFAKNAILFVKPESLQPGSKWLIACVAPDNSKSGPMNGVSRIGLIPLNYVKLVMK